MMLLLLLIPWNWTLVTPALWNAARWKPAFQISDYIVKNGARLTVDGIRNPYWKKGSCTVTKIEKRPWLVVDLQGRYSIKKILLTNRLPKSVAANLKNFNVEFHQTDPRENSLFPDVQGEICLNRNSAPVPPKDNVFNCEEAVTGGFAVIRYHAGYTGRLTLCEFEVHVDAIFSKSVAYNRFKATRVTNRLFVSLQSHSVSTCAAECSSRRDQELCTAFNWNQARRECRLLSVYPYDPVDQVSDAGWNLYRVKIY